MTHLTGGYSRREGSTPAGRRDSRVPAGRSHFQILLPSVPVPTGSTDSWVRVVGPPPPCFPAPRHRQGTIQCPSDDHPSVGGVQYRNDLSRGWVHCFPGGTGRPTLRLSRSVYRGRVPGWVPGRRRRSVGRGRWVVSFIYVCDNRQRQKLPPNPHPPPAFLRDALLSTERVQGLRRPPPS